MDMHVIPIIKQLNVSNYKTALVFELSNIKQHQFSNHGVVLYLRVRAIELICNCDFEHKDCFIIEISRHWAV